MIARSTAISELESKNAPDADLRLMSPIRLRPDRPRTPPFRSRRQRAGACLQRIGRAGVHPTATARASCRSECFLGERSSGSERQVAPLGCAVARRHSRTAGSPARLLIHRSSNQACVTASGVEQQHVPSRRSTGEPCIDGGTGILELARPDSLFAGSATQRSAGHRGRRSGPRGTRDPRVAGRSSSVPEMLVAE